VPTAGKEIRSKLPLENFPGPTDREVMTLLHF